MSVIDTALVSCALALALAAGCSADPPSDRSRATSGGAAQGGAGGTMDPGTGGSGASGGNAGNTGDPTGGGGRIVVNDASADQRVTIDAPACSAVVAENEIIVVTTTTPVDLYFVYDKSSSMLLADVIGSPNRWDAMAAAIAAFVDSSAMDGGSAGLGIGMTFFPIGTPLASCNVAEYALPIVDVAPLPGNAAAIKNAVATQMLGLTTPTLPALQGAVQYGTTYQMAHPDRRLVLVLATDGEPNDCNSNAPAVAVVAAGAAAQMPPLNTYVLGIGPSTGNLDAIAIAGGTNAAYMVTAAGTTQLLQALNAIRTKTQTQVGTKISCSQKIPPSQFSRALDYGATVVKTTIGDAGISMSPPRVADRAACGTMEGWYFDDPKQPTTIEFCPATCSAVSTGRNRLTIEIPCLPVPPPPPSYR
jgi:von Willebrand factor type A domain